MKRILVFLSFMALALFAGRASAATVLITGSNRGLGLEFAKEYAAQGWTVIATVRNPASAAELKALAAGHPNVVIEKLDVTDSAGIKELAAKYRGRPIDVLINNAGVLGNLAGQSLGSFDPSEFQEVMRTNVFGPLAVSEAFRDNVIQSDQKKIVAITSGSGSMTRSRGGMLFYGVSKTALNMAMISLAHKLKEDGVIVGLIAPGGVDTDMLRQAFGPERAAHALKPSESVSAMIKLIDRLTPAESGKPLNYDGTALPW